MLKDFAIFALVWLGARFAWGVDLDAFHAGLFRLVAEGRGSLLGSALIVVCTLLLISYLCGTLRWYGPLYLLSRITFELSQLVLVCISCDAVILWFVNGINLWAQLGPLVASLPFLTFGASCYGFWMYDFNYPLQDRVLRNLAIPVISGLVVAVASFL